jgi:hypothetical protein
MILLRICTFSAFAQDQTPIAGLEYVNADDNGEYEKVEKEIW